MSNDLGLQLYQALISAAGLAGRGALAEVDGEDAAPYFNSSFALLDEALLIKQQLLSERICPFNFEVRNDFIDGIREAINVAGVPS
jgi:hypothetical protein